MRAAPRTADRRIGDDDPGQPVLGQHAGRVQRIGVDGHHREFLSKVLRVHISTIRPVLIILSPS